MKNTIVEGREGKQSNSGAWKNNKKGGIKQEKIYLKKKSE